MKESFKNCPYCGKLILEDAVFCKHCNKTLPCNAETKIKKNDVVQNPNKDTIEYKFGRICFILLVVAFIYSFLGDVWFQVSHLVPIPSSAKKIQISLPGYSNQTDLKIPKQININTGKKHRILLAQAEYSLEGLVIAINTNFWLRGIMQNDFDEVVPIDFGIVWGNLANVKYLKKHFKFKSEKTLGEARMLYWHWDRNVTEPFDYINSHISHNHIIPANDNITSALLRVKKWDIVRLDGYLVDIINPRGYTSYTSLSRSDTNATSRGANQNDGAGGACEIFYVTGVYLKNRYYK